MNLVETVQSVASILSKIMANMHIKSFAYIRVVFDIRFQGRIQKYFFKVIRTRKNALFFSCWGHARYFYGFVIDQDLLLFRKHSPSNTLREHHHGSI